MTEVEAEFTGRAAVARGKKYEQVRAKDLRGLTQCRLCAAGTDGALFCADFPSDCAKDDAVFWIEAKEKGEER